MYDYVSGIIDNIAATKGSNAKQDLVTKAIADEGFNVITCLALDPFKTYGINKLPKVAPESNKSFDMETVHLLHELSSRKITGNVAVNAVKVELSLLTPAGADLFTKVIKKDLKAGFTAKSVNKAKPGAIPSFECMLSHKYEEKRIKQWPVAVEEKYDGVRCLALITRSGVKFLSRNGKTEFTGLDHVAEDLLGSCEFTTEVVFDGELVSGSFNDTVSETRRKEGDKSNTQFVVFDIITMEGFRLGGSRESYQERRKAICTLFPLGKFKSVRVSDLKMCHSHQEVLDTYFTIVNRGGEGVIVKPTNGIYECKRSYNWLKVKEQQSVDVPITGLAQGDADGKFANTLGALVVDVEGVECRVGGGLTEILRDEIWSNPDAFIGRIVEVEFHQKTPDGSLRHPRFVRFRDDKDIEDGVGA